MIVQEIINYEREFPNSSWMNSQMWSRRWRHGFEHQKLLVAPKISKLTVTKLVQLDSFLFITFVYVWRSTLHPLVISYHITYIVI